MRILIICGDHPRNTYFLKNILNFKKAEVIKIVLFKREKLIPEPPSNLEIDLKNFGICILIKELLQKKNTLILI